MAECPCSNISIMQLFHELKQKFPAVPDRVVSECIKSNAHDKEACEAVLAQEDQAYGSPSGRVCKMAAEGEACRPDSLALDVDDLSLDFDRRLPGRQSLDSLTCRARRARKRHSEPACQCPRSAPVTPVVPFPPLVVDVSAHRLRTQATVEPSLRPEPSRPFTMVNLTLRPPSSDLQPIDISSGAGGLTYSSCSYDPRQGFQSHLQIKIGPGGTGSVTAARTRPPHPLRLPVVPSLRAASSLPDVATTSSQIDDPFIHHLPPDTKALVCEQLRRRDQLSFELLRHRERLRRMRRDKQTMDSDLAARLTAPGRSQRVRCLRDEITCLQGDCDRLANEVMQKAESRHIIETLPIGETNEEFYKNIYRGQIFPRPAARHRGVGTSEGGGGDDGGGGGARNWTCHVCTFHNHPALNKCEQCDMPRIITGSVPDPPKLPPPKAACV